VKNSRDGGLQRRAVNKRQALDGGNLHYGMPSVGPSKSCQNALFRRLEGYKAG
jgi:hypothetical protein